MPTLAPKLPFDHRYAAGFSACTGYQSVPTDPDAIDYLNRVAAADGAAVEVGVAMAVDAFVRGCKADSAGYAGDPTRTVWDAMQASCIMCGARTISGALVPLVGAAPTPYNFASGDYDRSGTPGLKGDGTTKYLDSNRDSSDDPQDDCHLSVYETATHVGTAFGASIGGFDASTPSQKVIFYRDSSLQIVGRLNNVDATSFTRPSATTGFTGVSRSSGSGLTLRYAGSDNEISQPSVTMANRSISVFSQDTGAGQSNYSNARIAFYSVGSAIDLAALDTRVSQLVTGIKFHSLTGLVATDYDPDTVAYIVAAYEAGGTL